MDNVRPIRPGITPVVPVTGLRPAGQATDTALTVANDYRSSANFWRWTAIVLGGVSVYLYVRGAPAMPRAAKPAHETRAYKLGRGVAYIRDSFAGR